MCDQQSLRSACAYAQSDQNLCQSLEYSMIVKLLTEHLLEFLSLKGGCRGSSESTLIKMPHCWQSHALALNLCKCTSAFQVPSHVIFFRRSAVFKQEEKPTLKLSYQKHAHGVYLFIFYQYFLHNIIIYQREPELEKNASMGQCTLKLIYNG